MDDVNAADTTLRMPDDDVSITAVYESIPPTLYELRVTKGTGSGAYTAGAEIPIAADPAPDDKYFAGWTGDTTCLDNPLSPNAIVDMPAKSAAVTATYADVPPTFFNLTVTSGTGSGAYTAGAIVPVNASMPTSGRIFVAWKGDTAYLDNACDPCTVARMPAADISVEATYADIPPTPYTLTVANGSGSGAYIAGTVVSIAANDPPDGKYFVMWAGQTDTVDNILWPDTTLTMPTAAASVTATYAGIPPTLFDLTVLDGSGSGAYTAGTDVAIVADTAPSGKRFAMWTGQTATVANILLPATTVRVLESDVRIQAAYEDVPPTLYKLTVANGSGSGSYAAGTDVSITAAAAPSGKIFAQWTGMTATVANILLPSTTLRMLPCALSVEATYMDIPPTPFDLTVVNGSGSGSYTAGTAVKVVADAPASGKMFDKWTGDSGYLADPAASETILTMPAASVKITATYKAAPSNLRTLTVTGGSGSGSYAEGAAVPVVAAAPASGKMFYVWIGDTGILLDPYSSSTVVTMPAEDAAIEATYMDDPSTRHVLTVTDGSGSGTYATGTPVRIAANAPPAGKLFDAWTGDTTKLLSAAAPSSIIIMPDADATLAATYKDAPSGWRTLSVANGSGSGTYAAGTLVRITADTPASGMVFKSWSTARGTLLDATASETILTMPDADTAAAAAYEAVAAGFHTLVVLNGLGSGVHEAYDTVSVSAGDPPFGMVFSAWTGDTDCLYNPYAANTFLAMPDADAAVAAVYTDASASLPTLTVGNGSTTGPVASGSVVTASASDPPPGQTFSAWIGDTECLLNPSSPTTRLLMPSSDAAILAVHADAAEGQYQLAVIGGSGSGAYAESAAVKIAAQSRPGFVFSKWTGDTGALLDPTAAETQLLMPASPVRLAASFTAAAAATLSITANTTAGGAWLPSGSVDIPSGEDVTISAFPSSGYVFAGWTTSTTSTTAIAGPSSAVTTVSVASDGTINTGEVKANFASEIFISTARIETYRSPWEDKVDITLASLPWFDPSSSILVLSVGAYDPSSKYDLEFDRGYWTLNESKYIYHYRDKWTTATYNPAAGTLKVSARALSIGRLISSPIDLLVVLSVDGNLYGARLATSVTTQWSYAAAESTAASRTLAVDDLDLSVNSANGKAASVKSEAGRCVVAKATASFPKLSPTDNLMLQINNLAILVPYSSFAGGVYKSKGPPTVKWSIGAASGKWSASIDKTDTVIDPVAGVGVMLSVGQPSQGDTTHTGSKLLDTTWKRVYLYNLN